MKGEHLANWILSLVAHPDHVFVAYIHDGLSQGAQLNLHGMTLFLKKKILIFFMSPLAKIIYPLVHICRETYAKICYCGN